jgi:hypothetical protein
VPRERKQSRGYHQSGEQVSGPELKFSISKTGGTNANNATRCGTRRGTMSFLLTRNIYDIKMSAKENLGYYQTSSIRHG